MDHLLINSWLFQRWSTIDPMLCTWWTSASVLALCPGLPHHWHVKPLICPPPPPGNWSTHRHCLLSDRANRSVWPHQCSSAHPGGNHPHFIHINRMPALGALYTAMWGYQGHCHHIYLVQCWTYARYTSRRKGWKQLEAAICMTVVISHYNTSAHPHCFFYFVQHVQSAMKGL